MSNTTKTRPKIVTPVSKTKVCADCGLEIQKGFSGYTSGLCSSCFAQNCVENYYFDKTNRYP